MFKKLLILIILLLLSGCAAKQAYVSITFDDGGYSTYENAFPILSKYGFPATTFVVTSYIGSDKNFMDWDQLSILSRLGKWEIGSHSHAHPDLTALSQEQIEYELKRSKEILISRGFSPIGFASPYGQFNDAALQFIKKHYKYHRNAWQVGLEGFNSIDNLDLYNISSIEILHDMSFEEKRWIIEKAITQNKWVVMHMHRVVKGKPKEYEINIEAFQKFVDYLKSRNVKVVTVADFLRDHNLVK